MRGKSKVWDEMPNRPIALKQRLADAGRSMKWLADEVVKRGYKISRVTIWCVINKDYRTKKFERLKTLIEEILQENGISTRGIWSKLPDGEKMMRKIRPLPHTEEYQNKEVNEVNYTRMFLDEEVLQHFGLQEDPFFDTGDFTEIWLSPRHKVIERRVYDTIKRHGIMAIVGPIGAGKTTFLRYLLGKLTHDKNIKVVYPDRLDRKQLLGSSLTQGIIRELGGVRIPRSGVERDAVARRLLEENVRSGIHQVLVLDEAHDLKEEAFIALKRLWDSGMLFRCLSILLVGQGGIDKYGNSYGLLGKLEYNPWIREFAERCYTVDMGDLNGSMRSYLEYRFKRVGGEVDRVFEAKALNLLTTKADVPQLVNNICIRAMIAAYRDGRQKVMPEHIAEV